MTKVVKNDGLKMENSRTIQLAEQHFYRYSSIVIPPDPYRSTLTLGWWCEASSPVSINQV